MKSEKSIRNLVSEVLGELERLNYSEKHTQQLPKTLSLDLSTLLTGRERTFIQKAWEADSMVVL